MVSFVQVVLVVIWKGLLLHRDNHLWNAAATVQEEACTVGLLEARVQGHRQICLYSEILR